MIKITNERNEDLGLIDPTNAISKFTFNAIHEVEGVTRLILAEVDMNGFQANINLELGEAKPIPGSVARKNPYHPPVTIDSIENPYPETINVVEKNGFFMVTGINPGEAEVELRFETGECHRTDIMVTSQQIPGLSVRVFWPMLGELRLPKGYSPSPRECFELRADNGRMVVWLMTDYVHNVQIRNNGAIKAVVPTVLEELPIPLFEVNFSDEPYICTRNVFLDTMAISLPRNVGTGMSGEELSWFLAEDDGIRKTSFAPAEEGIRNFVLKAKDYLGEYIDVRVKHPKETAHNILLLKYQILPWDLASELENHLNIRDGSDKLGAFKHIKISTTLQHNLPPRYKNMPWEVESEQFYTCDTINDQLKGGVDVEFKVYRGYHAPTYDTILLLNIGGLPEINVPLAFDPNLDLKEEMLIDTALHLYKHDEMVTSFTLQLPSSLKQLPSHGWGAKLRLGGATPSEHRISYLDFALKSQTWDNIEPFNTPSVAHLEVSHPFGRPIHKEIKIFKHASDWSWVDESYLTHKLVRYCKKFQKRIEFKSSGHSLGAELYELDIASVNPFGYPTRTRAKRLLVGDSIDVQDYSFIMEFSRIKGTDPRLIRLIQTEDLKKELGCDSMIFGISSDWQNEGENWRDKKHFEEDNTSIIFSASKLPLDETSNDGMYTFSSPGVYLMLAKLGSPQWYCAQPEHIDDENWPDGLFGCYRAVLEIEVF